MPKKKSELNPEEQAERFRRAVEELEASGELSATEAEERFERAMDKIRHHKEDNPN